MIYHSKTAAWYTLHLGFKKLEGDKENYPPHFYVVFSDWLCIHLTCNFEQNCLCSPGFPVWPLSLVFTVREWQLWRTFYPPPSEADRPKKSLKWGGTRQNILVILGPAVMFSRGHTLEYCRSHFAGNFLLSIFTANADSAKWLMCYVSADNYCLQENSHFFAFKAQNYYFAP